MTRAAVECVLGCVEYVTRYAYIYVGAVGTGFCPSALATCRLVARYAGGEVGDVPPCTLLGHRHDLACR